jgi:high-affinity nickel-transport protein
VIRQSHHRAVFWASLSGRERRSLVAMVSAVAGMHVLGFVALLAFIASSRYHPGKAGALTIGIGITAYTLGLRHAFDADHISAIDNTTRKLMAEGKRPLSVGFWFSLGHSTIVFALTLLISIGVRSLDGPVERDHSTLRQGTSLVGTAVSGGFLYLIAAINIVILLGIVKVFREMRRTLRRSRARPAAGQSRVDEPSVRPPDQARGQAAAHVSGRATVRAGVRHGE